MRTTWFTPALRQSRGECTMFAGIISSESMLSHDRTRPSCYQGQICRLQMPKHAQCHEMMQTIRITATNSNIEGFEIRLLAASLNMAACTQPNSPLQSPLSGSHLSLQWQTFPCTDQCLRPDRTRMAHAHDRCARMIHTTAGRGQSSDTLQMAASRLTCMCCSRGRCSRARLSGPRREASRATTRAWHLALGYRSCIRTHRSSMEMGAWPPEAALHVQITNSVALETA